jgi:MoaA/NifB/PqqE/SkfB family radical SAM enzyme
MSLRDLRRDAAFAAGLLRRRPFDVLVQVTNRCNMKCSFCDFWPNGASPREELTVAEYRRVAVELAELGTFVVSIEGGEPFVRPDLVEIVRAFGGHHLPFLYTNGWYVEPESAGALFDAGLAQAGVSIDYPDAARHDAKRGLAGAFERAWRAVERFRDAAPYGGRQVHVMTVLMRSNQRDLEPLLELSGRAGVGHHVTLLATEGYRRGRGVDALPDRPMSAELLRLRARYPHFRTFRDYAAGVDAFLSKGALPTCRAGAQSFNIDHLGNVAPCIEKIDRPVGNVRDEGLAALHAKLRGLEEVATCQACWSLCRGTGQALGRGGSPAAWWDMATRMRSR